MRLWLSTVDPPVGLLQFLVQQITALATRHWVMLAQR